MPRLRSPPRSSAIDLSGEIHLQCNRNKDSMNDSREEKNDFSRLRIYKRFRDGSEPQPVAAFLTHYGARKALNRLMAEETEEDGCEWVIVPVPPIRPEE